MSINFEKICNNLSLGNIIENAEKLMVELLIRCIKFKLQKENLQ